MEGNDQAVQANTCPRLDDDEAITHAHRSIQRWAGQVASVTLSVACDAHCSRYSCDKLSVSSDVHQVCTQLGLTLLLVLELVLDRCADPH